MAAMTPNRALKIAIAASGRKQKDVARQARIDQWRLSRIVHNDAAPTPEEQARLARVLRTPVDELFEAGV
jgi:transcriptional regulator with XRE-family HTH domain